MNYVIIYKIISIAFLLIFLRYGYDMRKKSTMKNSISPLWLSIMKINAWGLASIYLATLLVISELFLTDYIGLLLLAFGAFLVRAAKNKLEEHHAFTWTGYVLEKPQLVTDGVYAFMRHPLYTGVYCVEIAGCLTVLPHLVYYLPDYSVYLVIAAGLSVCYAMGFNAFSAHKETQYLKGQFGYAYELYAQNVRAFIPSCHIANFLRYRHMQAIFKGHRYAQSIANYLRLVCNRGANASKAATVLAEGYDATVHAGHFVNDLQVLEQKGVHLKVLTQQGHIFDAVNLATNSYHDLDLEPECREKLLAYMREGALSSCLSRKVAGSLPIHALLEKELCDFMGYDKCILATSGYIAQIATVFSLFREGDVIFSDQHNHSSLIDGMQLSKAKVIIYPHLDYQALERLLKQHRHRYNCAGIISDGIFSAHGTMADLDVIHRLKAAYNCLSIIDDTHGFVAIGQRGRGALDFYTHKPDILTASMAKGLAGFGGFMLADGALIQVINNLGRQNINTSHLSPIIAAQCYENLRYFRLHLDRILGETTHKLKVFNSALARKGLQVYADDGFIHPIFSFYKESEEEVTSDLAKLFEMGFIGAFFPPPVAPFPTIRFSVHRYIPDETLIALADALAHMNFKVMRILPS